MFTKFGTHILSMLCTVFDNRQYLSTDATFIKHLVAARCVSDRVVLVNLLQ